MRICIMYDTQFGNGKKLVEYLASTLPTKYEVKIGDVKELPHSKVVDFKPDMLILGGAIRMFNTSPKSKKWLKSLNTQLRASELTIPFGTAFLTHALPNKYVRGWGNRFLKKMVRAPTIGKCYPECLFARVKDQEGPFIEGELDKARDYLNGFLEWTKN
ncbi:MAG: hypothetical protein ACTSRK_06545 [Promethearchaeota archaeon]